MDGSTSILFTWLDYALFFGMLIASVVIGVYFGFFGKKQNSPLQYLHGGKKLKILPVAASLIATDISGLTLLAIPADIYVHGISFTSSIFATMIMTTVISYVFLPVFYKLQVNSSFEYLTMRFSSRVCKMASFLYSFVAIIYFPVLIYIPAIALNQVSGLQLNYVIPLICVICIFYTTIGGIKAVIWTDALQLLIMIGSILTVFMIGVSDEGGFINIWTKAIEGGRAEFNWDLDPTNSNSCFTVIIGISVIAVGFGSNPIFTQRFLSLPTIKDAKKTAVIFCMGSIFFKLVACFLGLIIYSHYASCSPLLTGDVKAPDQIMPYYIMDVSSILPGLPGIFISGVFGASLSTISSGLNTMSGTIYEDFLKRHFPANISDKKASNIIKLIVVITGLIFIFLVFLVQYLGTILQLSITLAGIILGPILAMFALGMLVPMINEKGILYGSVSGILFVSWIIFGANYYRMVGRLNQPYLPLQADSCTVISNNTIYVNTTLSDNLDPPMYLYRISYYYYALLGFLATTTVAFTISFMTGGFKETVDKKLLSPIIYQFLRKNPKSKENFIIETELQNVKNHEDFCVKI